MPYRRLRSLHFWLTVVLVLPLLTASVTGAVLVYGKEIQDALTPDSWRPAAGAEERPLPVSRIFERLSEQRPELKPWALSVPPETGSGWRVWLSGGAGVLAIDPSDGRILAHFQPRDTVEGWVTALHRRYLTEGSAAKWARHLVSAVALLLILQLAVGLWMWLTPPLPLKRLAVRRGYGPRLLTLRLHQLCGVSMALVLVVVAFTGMAMYWRGPTKAVLEWVAFGPIREAQPPKFDGLAPLSDLDAAVAMALSEAGPDAGFRSARPPDRPGAPAVIGVAPPGQKIPARFWIGDAPPRILFRDDPADDNLATWIWRRHTAIHMGDFAGPLVRALWLLVALLPAGFALSGLWLHLDRRRRTRPARPRAKAASEGVAAAGSSAAPEPSAPSPRR